MYKKILFLFSFLLPLQLFAANTYVVAITQYDNSDVYQQAYRGVIEGLKEQGFIEGKNINIIYENANGDLNRVDEIAKAFVAQKPNVIIPISTPSALAIVKADTNAGIPVVFAAVIQPLVQHGEDVTGVYSFIPISKGNDEVGYLAGRIAGLVLAGKSPEQIDVVSPADTELFINIKAAEHLNLPAPKKP